MTTSLLAHLATSLAPSAESIATELELSSFIRPDNEPGSPDAKSTELGLRNVGFEVDDLNAILDRLAADGYRLVGGVGQFEHVWRMAYLRGPEGIVVLDLRIG